MSDSCTQCALTGFLPPRSSNRSWAWPYCIGDEAEAGDLVLPQATPTPSELHELDGVLVQDNAGDADGGRGRRRGA